MILFGASGHAKVIAEILMSIDRHVNLILDDNPKVSEIFGIPVQRFDTEMHSTGNAMIAIGNNVVRKKVAESKDFTYTSAIHPSATVSRFSSLGAGSVVMAGAVINPDTVVGKHCILNTGCIIDHDCTLDDFVHISPNAALAGNVSVGEGTHIGIGASVIQGVRIGKWCTIGAGAVIIRDVPDDAVVVGNPGKIIKYNDRD